MPLVDRQAARDILNETNLLREPVENAESGSSPVLRSLAASDLPI